MRSTATHRRSADGWLATALGGIAGAAVLCVTAYFAVGAYFSQQPYSDGLEELGWMLLGGAVGISVGAAAGGALALKAGGYRRAIGSGLLFSVFACLSLIGWFLIANEHFEDWDEPVVLLIPVLTLVPGSAWLARWLLSTRGQGAGSAPPE